ncbi:uncharacterized protein BDZ99DRAFT_467243 [Mytilinidion resinicola]|uniref:Uncharacterized protein n=1 Tax=Mytilinidion resinicola TaxID=574789 RepID=A0A6A6Y8T8_9PEZI|nr:uncharacterized protein BDZ99DRAFT_467243 [Mytilinidion resinicola]KAF2804545.1 hypothetical protein BDZ99DRAFT_467243 [Mytilinidion resinicola]
MHYLPKLLPQLAAQETPTTDAPAPTQPPPVPGIPAHPAESHMPGNSIAPTRHPPRQR